MSSTFKVLNKIPNPIEDTLFNEQGTELKTSFSD